MLSEPRLRSGQATHLSVQFNCLISPPKNCGHRTSDLYLPCVCAFLSLSPSSDFSGRLKLLYYSPRVCQIPQQLQTHHPSLALCLKGNKVSGFPGWQICVIVLCPSWGEQLSGHRRREKEKRREREGRCDRVADQSAFLSENWVSLRGGSSGSGGLRPILLTPEK